MNTDRVLTMVTPDWRQKCALDFDPRQMSAADVVAAVAPDGAGLKVVKHQAYRTPFLMMGAMVEDLTNRPCKTFYSVNEEVYYQDLQDVLEQYDNPVEYCSCLFRNVLIEAMATTAAGAAIEHFVEDVCERAGDDAADQVAGTLPEEDLGVVIAAWIKERLKFDIMVAAGPVTHHKVTAEDLAYQQRPTTEPVDPDPVWLIKTFGMDDARMWVTDVRNAKRTVDQVTERTIKDPKDPARQRFRRGLRWLAETPDVEWERFGGDEGRTS